MNTDFMTGVDLYLKMSGPRRDREKEEWMRGFQERQFGLQKERFGLEQRQSGQAMQLQQIQMQEIQRKTQQEKERRQALQNLFVGKKIGEGEEAFLERDIPAPGQIGQFYEPRIREYLGSTSDIAGAKTMMELAKGFLPKEDVSITETEALMLPESDPRRQLFIKGKQTLQLPQSESSGIQEYNFAVKQGFKGTFMDWKQRIKTDRQSDFDTKWGLSGKIASEMLRNKGIDRAPTMSEVADAYKAKFGTAGLIEMLFGLMSGESAGPQGTPKF